MAAVPRRRRARPARPAGPAVRDRARAADRGARRRGDRRARRAGRPGGGSLRGAEALDVAGGDARPTAAGRSRRPRTARCAGRPSNPSAGSSRTCGPAATPTSAGGWPRRAGSSSGGRAQPSCIATARRWRRCSASACATAPARAGWRASTPARFRRAAGPGWRCGRRCARKRPRRDGARGPRRRAHRAARRPDRLGVRAGTTGPEPAASGADEPPRPRAVERTPVGRLRIPGDGVPDQRRMALVQRELGTGEAHDVGRQPAGVAAVADAARRERRAAGRGRRSHRSQSSATRSGAAKPPACSSALRRIALHDVGIGLCA